MNLLHELEKVLYHPTYMGQSDKAGVNLAVNDILNKIEELGFEIVEKEQPIITPEDKARLDQHEAWESFYLSVECALICTAESCKKCDHYDTCQLYENN